MQRSMLIRIPRTPLSPSLSVLEEAAERIVSAASAAAAVGSAAVGHAIGSVTASTHLPPRQLPSARTPHLDAYDTIDWFRPSVKPSPRSGDDDRPDLPTGFSVRSLPFTGDSDGGSPSDHLHRTGTGHRTASDEGEDGTAGFAAGGVAADRLRPSRALIELVPGGLRALEIVATIEAKIASFGITEEWILALIIGLVTGLVAAYIDVLVEWTTDIRQGYCARQFSASEAMCCLGMEEMGCPDWRPWFGARWTAVPFKYVVYTLLSMLFATLAATIVKGFAPHARGGGAAEVKTILGGVIMHEVLSFRTLVGKIVTLPLSIGSGLVLGKEASMIHLSAAIGHSLCWITPAIERSEVRKRAIIAVATAAGFASAFGSPIAGVMFVFEELATFFHGDSMILSFFAALISNVALQLIRPYRGRRTIYQVTYTRDWQWFELYPFALLGVFGGVMGMLFNRGFLHAKRLRSQPWFRVTPVVEAALMAFATAVISYPNVFMRGGNLNLLGHLFRECNEDDFSGLCSEGAWFSTVLSLTVALVLKTGLAIVTVGVQVPGGVFIPAMIYGGIFGRIVGICIEALSKAHPEWPLFDQCHPDKPCITPGIYGLLGAMAGLGGLTRLTVTLTVVMFELTGTLHYVVPCMVTLFVAKVTGDFFDPMPFSETQIESQNYPFLDPKLELNTGFDIGDVMTNVSDLVTLAAASPIPIEVLENLVDHTTLTGWPVIISPTDLTLVGYIYRGDLQRYLTSLARSDRTRTFTHVALDHLWQQHLPIPPPRTPAAAPDARRDVHGETQAGSRVRRRYSPDLAAVPVPIATPATSATTMTAGSATPPAGVGTATGAPGPLRLSPSAILTANPPVLVPPDLAMVETIVPMSPETPAVSVGPSPSAAAAATAAALQPSTPGSEPSSAMSPLLAVAPLPPPPLPETARHPSSLLGYGVPASPPRPPASAGQVADFTALVDRNRITVDPAMSFELVLTIFQKMGPRVVLVAHQGQLCGLITRKDMIHLTREFVELGYHRLS